jgi:hypothetical protein
MTALYLRCDRCEKVDFPPAASDYRRKSFHNQTHGVILQLEQDAIEAGWLVSRENPSHLRKHFCPACRPAPRNICPKCGKDMTIRPGAILTCGESICVYWRAAL